MEQEMETAEREASFNEVEAASLDQIADDQAWLVNNEPEPTTVGTMQTRIQQLAENEALRAGLTVKRKSFGDEVVDPSLNYHRARFQIEVNGREEAIYRWLDRLHRPSEFRAVTYVRLSPQRNDATKADCEIYLDQWFVPRGGQI
jgi:hypothetical protein